MHIHPSLLSGLYTCNTVYLMGVTLLSAFTQCHFHTYHMMKNKHIICMIDTHITTQWLVFYLGVRPI